MTEFELIRQYFQREAAHSWCRLGIGDDAAIVRPPPQRELAVCTDTLVAGRHFPHHTAAADIGWKALAVNLSDLAAMGAKPMGFLLNLTLPDNAPAFVGELARGLFELASAHDVALIGGDTTRGPLSLSVTAFGHLAPGQALRRDAARPGDVIVVAGELGGAALALAQGQAAEPALRAYLDRPQPQVEAGLALVDCGHAAIDISDGLAADLGHILAASNCGAQIELEALPLAPQLAALSDAEAMRLALHGGDDYALIATLSRSAWAKLAQQPSAWRAVGEIVESPGLHARTRGAALEPIPVTGYTHF